MPRERIKCPVCGDPGPFCLWIDDEPPQGCADDPQGLAGGIRTIRNVTECPRQMKEAKRAGLWRKMFPEWFDANGKILPGGLVHILNNWPLPTNPMEP